jgi:predicted DNA-binding transcriptional regulator
MKDVAHILKPLGFTESEITTYLSTLEHGAGTALQISSLTGISRQTIYLAIDALMQRGLMTCVEQEKGNLFSSEPPQKLLDYAQRRAQEMQNQVEDLASLIPEIELRSAGERPIVKMYEGREGVLAMIREVQQTDQSDAYEIADLDALYETLTADDLAPLSQHVRTSKLRVHGVYAGQRRGGMKDDLTIHFLPQNEHNFRANVTVFGQNVALISFVGKMHSVFIQNQAIADALRILFRHALDSLPTDINS